MSDETVSDETFDQLLATVLEREVPGCSELVSVEQLSGGASQETYRLTITQDDSPVRLALRRAPRGEAGEPTEEHPGLEVEAELIMLARSQGVPEPEIFYVLQDKDGLGDGIIMEWLVGEALGSRIVRSPDLAEVRPKLAYECGEILGRIHQLELPETLRGRLTEVSPERFITLTWELYQSFNTPQPMIDYTARWLLENLPPAVEPRLVHNDFRNGNLMIDDNGVRAVLDWELAHLGDPMRDLGWLCVRSWRFGNHQKAVGGFGDQADLFAGYESVTGTPVNAEHVKFWEIFGSFWWAVHCLTMAETYRTGLSKSVERPGIARRSSECQVDCANLIFGSGQVPRSALATESASAVEPGEPDEMPTITELLESVAAFLRTDVMGATEGRTKFLSRVAANSLDIAIRDLDLGPQNRANEQERIRALTLSPTRENANLDLTALRWKLARALRSESITLDHPGLAAHLRVSTANQLAVDQPKYPGLQTVISTAKVS